MTEVVDIQVPSAPTVTMTPQAFVEQLERLAATRPAAEVVAFYDRYGPAVQPLLRGNNRLSVAAIMEVADTVVEHEAAAHTNGTTTALSDRQPQPKAAAPTRHHS